LEIDRDENQLLVCTEMLVKLDANEFMKTYF